jgi:hypothetical protein
MPLPYVYDFRSRDAKLEALGEEISAIGRSVPQAREIRAREFGSCALWNTDGTGVSTIFRSQAQSRAELFSAVDRAAIGRGWHRFPSRDETFERTQFRAFERDGDRLDLTLENTAWAESRFQRHGSAGFTIEVGVRDDCQRDVL